MTFRPEYWSTPTNAPAAPGNYITISQADARYIMAPDQTAIALAASGGSALVGFTQSGAGAVQRTVQAKGRDIVSVLDFSGADPTGVADSTTAFNNAAASAQFVIIPSGGTYKISGTVSGTTTFLNLGSTISGNISAPYVNLQSAGIGATGFVASVNGFSGALGSTWQTQFHANWNVIQSQVADNPTEWQVYSNSSGGVVTTVSGTNQVTWLSGSKFSTYWAGLPYIYIDGVNYKVLAVTDQTHLTVQTLAGGAVSFASSSNVPYYFCTTSNKGFCNTNGTAVTLASGQPFNSLTSQITINGVSYTIASWNSTSSLTLSSSAGIQSNVAFAQYMNINNELSTLRLQATSNADQENFCITETANGAIIENQYGGNGKYRPILIRTGETPAGNQLPMVSLYPAATLGNPGNLLLGGNFVNCVMNIVQNSTNVNYFYASGGPTGLSPSYAVRGSDTNVSMAFDTQGTGGYTFTSHSFANTEFQVFGAGGSSWLSVASSASNAPAISANGAAANIDINLAPKGTGAVLLGVYTAGAPTAGGYVTVKDSTGAVRKLLCA